MATTPQIFYQIGTALTKGDVKAGKKLIKSAEKIYPNSPHLFFQKGYLEYLNKSDKKTVVLPLYRKAYEFDELKQNANFLFVYGSLLFELEEYRYDIDSLKILGDYNELKPDDYGVISQIATLFYKTGNLVSAIETCKMILEKQPENVGAHNTLANAFTDAGFHEAAFETFRKVLEYSNNNMTFVGNYVYSSNYVDLDRKETFLLHQKYLSLYESEILPARPPFPQAEKIKVGFISGDLNNHAVGYFITALFENYDKSKFEIHLFSNSQKSDHVSQKFKDLTDNWHDIWQVNNKQVADLIKKEKITVLIDLSGHTGHNRLAVLGLRPAPVQATYCGYPNTTGLKSIDYRISDNVCEPSDAQDFHSEKLYKLDDCFLCYTPPNGVPETHFEPLDGRPIIFGSFNNLRKLTKKTMMLWSMVINYVPNAKIALKYRSMNDQNFRKLVISRFAEVGLSEDKIIIFDYSTTGNEHFGQYYKIDIALDSFPYNGTTTTCEALYMGVPVITILGDRHVSRVSASLLNAVGLPDLAAKNETEFVKIAVSLAQNTEKLTEIKKTLRERMKNSPLMNGKSFTEKFQNAILEMIDEIRNE